MSTCRHVGAGQQPKAVRLAIQAVVGNEGAPLCFQQCLATGWRPPSMVRPRIVSQFRSDHVPSGPPVQAAHEVQRRCSVSDPGQAPHAMPEPPSRVRKMACSVRAICSAAASALRQADPNSWVVNRVVEAKPWRKVKAGRAVSRLNANLNVVAHDRIRSGSLVI